MSRLKELYNKEIIPAMMKEFSYKHVHSVPRLEKIVLNMGVKDAVKDKKKIDFAIEDMTLISGQKPLITKAKKSIAGFRLRKDMPVGCKVTLRRNRMYEFLDRLIYIALPRVKDFRGVSSKSFDGNGNYSLGIKEQIIFPEINFDNIDQIRGMDIIICTTSKSDEVSKFLMKQFKFPIR